MEWGKREARVAVVALCRCGKKPMEIFNLLKPLNITIRFIYRAIKWFHEHSTIGDKARLGCPRSSRTPEVIKAVRERIWRNPLHKQKIMSRELNVSTRTMSRIIRDDVHMKAYRRGAPVSRMVSWKKSGMKEQRGFFSGMHLMSMKISSSQTKEFNKQCDKVYAQYCAEGKERTPRVQWGINQDSWWYGGVYHTMGWHLSISVERELKPGQRST